MYIGLGPVYSLTRFNTSQTFTWLVAKVSCGLAIVYTDLNARSENNRGLQIFRWAHFNALFCLYCVVVFLQHGGVDLRSVEWHRYISCMSAACMYITAMLDELSMNKGQFHCLSTWQAAGTLAQSPSSHDSPMLSGQCRSQLKTLNVSIRLVYAVVIASLLAAHKRLNNVDDNDDDKACLLQHSFIHPSNISKWNSSSCISRHDEIFFLEIV